MSGLPKFKLIAEVIFKFVLNDLGFGRVEDLVVSSAGQRPASYCHGIVSVVHPSVHWSVNSSFKKFLLRNY